MPRIIDKEECINCGACEPVCPVECISEVDGKRFIKAEDCIDCGACEPVCPVSCISEA
jgi:NAD-dependent dihydropyrimidine dehydrogenase PreA subunit